MRDTIKQFSTKMDKSQDIFFKTFYIFYSIIKVNELKLIAQFNRQLNGFR